MKQNADRARSLDNAELAKEMRDAAEQLFRLRFQMSMGQMEGLKKYQALKKERARMLTVLAERESGREEVKPEHTGKAKPTSKTKLAAQAKPKAPAAAKPVVKAAAKAKPKSVEASRKSGAAAKPVVKPKAAVKARKSSKG